MEDNVIYNKELFKAKSRNAFYGIDFYKKGKMSFMDDTYLKKFISSVKKLVRTSDEYNEYLNVLRNEYGLNYCQIHPNITLDVLQDGIEMHHGPIFSLNDICEIILRYMIDYDKKISTFTVASKVLEEHRKFHIQTVMLCENCHKLADAGKLFINLSLGCGDLKFFVEKYGNYMDPLQRKMYNQYVTQNMDHETTDNGLLIFTGDISKHPDKNNKNETNDK